MLTPRQKAAFDFIAERIGATGIAPSYDELRSTLGIKSRAGVHRVVVALERRGFIDRIPAHARSIRIRRTIASPAIIALLNAYKAERDVLRGSVVSPSGEMDSDAAEALAEMDQIIADAKRALA